MSKGGRGWVSANEITAHMGMLHRQLSNLSVLDKVWENEAGAMSKYWKLEAVEGDAIVVKTSSAMAAHELALKEAQLLRNLNKHFSKPWIRFIKRV